MRALNAKALAIVVLSVVSGMSFALGFMVGRVTTRESREAAPVSVYIPSPAPEAPGTASDKPPLSPEITIITEEKKKPVKTEPPKQIFKPTPKSGPQTASSTKGFYVQAGAFTDKKVAETMRIRLKGMGYDSYVKSPEQPGSGGIYKVRVGDFAKRQDAETLALKLKKEAIAEAFVSDSD